MKKMYLSCLCLLLLLSKDTFSQLLTQGFEGTFPPAGWTRINASTTGGNDWTLNDDPNLDLGPYPSRTGTKAMAYEYSTTSDANAWMITPALNLTAGVSYTISFYYRVLNSTFPEKMKVTVGNAATVAAQTTTLWNNAGGTQLTNTAYTAGTIAYTPASTGTFYFGFNCYSAADQFALVVDDILIETTPASVPGCTTNIAPANGATNVSSPSASFSWNAATGATGYDFYIGTTNPPTTLVTNTSATNVTINGLAYSTTYYWYVVPRNSAGPATTCQSNVTSFTTGAAPPVPANDDVCNAITLALDGLSNCQNTAGATSTGDPAFSNSTPNNTVWYQYTPAVTGPIQIRLARPAGVTTGLLNAWVGVYTATGTCPTLTLTEVAGNSLTYDLPNNPAVVRLTTSLTAGTPYYFMIDGFSGSAGQFCINLLTPPAAPNCTTNIAPANNASNVTLPPLNLSWNAAPNATAYDIFIGTTNPPTTAAAVDVTGTSVQLTGGAYNTTYYWYVVPKNNGVAATGCASNTTSFTTQAAPPPPVNDECASAIAISPYSGVVNGTTLGGTASAGLPLCATDPGDPDEDVWYKFTALQNGNATITVAGGASFDAVLQLFTGTCGSLTQRGSCIDATIGGQAEVMNLTGLVAGETYYLRVYDYSLGMGDNFTITATGVALPVQVATFKGEKQGAKNVLSWTTQSEQNNRGFELQRSADGRTFTSLGFVKSQAVNGSSTATLNYEFSDAKPFASSNYYRLNQLDKDGRSTYSNVVMLKGNKVGVLTLSSIYPNPVADKLNIVIAAPVNERITFIISDLAGKVVAQKATQVLTGDNILSMDVNQLSSGSYMIKAVCANGCETAVSKFVKQ